ncbi:VanZ family protein [Gemmiger formicilis]|uniref:VanZ family protein n=1 Tax=Gemmiger formicilis TaxID=745368 RepID=UPI00195D9B3F|nr:VanZ family protein [Gemmiger formicilis]MBM6916014.1 VanZ family protein [Gemmiger formicilis]HIX32876.1 VanZ family protein [Candidatus Gemmiger avium]
MQSHTRTPWYLILFRVLFTVALAATVYFIFSNSLEIARESSARSQQVMELLNSLLGRVGLGPLSEHFVRKLAHFCEFSLLGFWFMLCLRVYTRHFVRHVSWPLFFGLLTAVIDETIQLYVPGRSSSVKDVLLDFSGVLTGLFIALLILLFFRLCRLALRGLERENEE